MSEINYTFMTEGDDNIASAPRVDAAGDLGTAARAMDDLAKSACDRAEKAEHPIMSADQLLVEINGSLLTEPIAVHMSTIFDSRGLPTRVFLLHLDRQTSEPTVDFDLLMATKRSFEVRAFWCGTGRSSTMSTAGVISYEAFSHVAGEKMISSETVVIHAPWQPFF